MTRVKCLSIIIIRSVVSCDSIIGPLFTWVTIVTGQHLIVKGGQGCSEA